MNHGDGLLMEMEPENTSKTIDELIADQMREVLCALDELPEEEVDNIFNSKIVYKENK